MEMRLQAVVADVLGLDASEVANDLDADTADNWDSLNHLRIITAVEQEFGISLSMEEIQEPRSVARLQQIVLEAVARQ
jgi:acyl carrier protein